VTYQTLPLPALLFTVLCEVVIRLKLKSIPLLSKYSCDDNLKGVGQVVATHCP